MKVVRQITFSIKVIFLLVLFVSTVFALNKQNGRYIHWLQSQSMLHQSHILAQKVSGKRIQWQHPYGEPNPNMLIKHHSVWFNAYPSAMITRPHQNILQFLGDQNLWQDFSAIGIDFLHTGPVKLAGGLVGKKHTPTVDGWFDRISYQIDPRFGTEVDYKALVKTAKNYHAIIAGDIIPGHTGLGSDFLLAERNVGNYPGIYDMIQIKKADWNLLPSVKNIWQTRNLTQAEVKQLTEKGYIPGRLQRVMFVDPKIKHPVTGWNATAEIKGVDGKVRRWVYLHYFKAGQPTMNWLDPAYGAQRIVSGDIVKSLVVLGDTVLRIDANPFLGIEPRPHSLVTWSEGHPYSITVSDELASLIRKLGGFSFQELNLTLDAIKAFSVHGPDLSYDFITRPALEDAVLTGDARFLKLMFSLMKSYQISPMHLIHDMQNHDEITYELVHFSDHAKDKFHFGNQLLTGSQVRQLIVNRMHRTAINKQAPYNRLSSNGLCTTFVGLIATRLGIKDLRHISLAQKEKIKRIHLLMVMFNAMQPGVFGISGWDLVGALPLPAAKLKTLTKDGDNRWVNRGAYDLLNYDSKSFASTSGIPKAVALYGNLPDQLEDPHSFVSQLKKLLAIRSAYDIALSKQIILPVKNDSVIAMLHILPNHKGYEITAINFGDSVATAHIKLNQVKGVDVEQFKDKAVMSLLTKQTDSTIASDGILNISLPGLSGKILWIEN